MSRRDWAEEVLEEVNPEALFMDGLDDAIIGVTTGIASRVEGGRSLVVYSERRIIDAIMADGTSEEDAWDHYGFNIESAWVGPNTPLIIREIDEDEELYPR